MTKLELPKWANCWLTNPTERLPAYFDGSQYWDKFGRVINTTGYEPHHPEREGWWVAIAIILICGIFVASTLL
jgi:hypothetical protein